MDIGAKRRGDRRKAAARFLTAAGVSLGLTLAIFLILPVMQTIGDPTRNDTLVRNVDVGRLPPPPPPPMEQEIEEEEPPPEPPPKMMDEAPPLSLSQLELALNPGMGDGLMADFTIDLGAAMNGEDGDDSLNRTFSLADLDQRPRVLFQRAPVYPPELQRQQRKGTVYVVFMVDQQGLVSSPKVERTSDPAFDRAALEAVRQWRFEPGTRGGEKVQFKMGIPITFNAG